MSNPRRKLRLPLSIPNSGSLNSDLAETRRERKDPLMRLSRIELLDEEEGRPLIPNSSPISTMRVCFGKLTKMFDFGPKFEPREVYLDGHTQPLKFVPNVVRNQKYHLVTFVPVVLYEQFRFFFNLFFLLIAISQLVPALRVGFLFTYIAPLAFVLSITLLKEAWDDYKRFLRDREANSKEYDVLTRDGWRPTPSSRLRVGSIVRIEKNERVPADCVMLRCTDKNGAIFIRTDQLDGETDWKLRRPVPYCQKLEYDESLLDLNAWFSCEAPRKEIYDFIGKLTVMQHPGSTHVESLSLENTLWANTVIASGTVVGMVAYTGKETRAVMNASTPSSKVGLLDLELNRLSKVLFVVMLLLSFVLTAMKGFYKNSALYYFRFVLLLCSIIPISLRVNLDLAKTVYSVLMMKDKKIPETVVRTSTIPEELGRIEYLLTDKTGTLTQNEMIFKKLHLGRALFSEESLDELREHLRNCCRNSNGPMSDVVARATRTASSSAAVQPGTRSSIMAQAQAAHAASASGLNAASGVIRGIPASRKRPVEGVIRDAVTALALCHNVTPVFDETGLSYQAASPDEVALVKFAESVGMCLVERDQNSITIKNAVGDLEKYEILANFPFTSESKRMGIIVKHVQSGRIIFYLKGAEAIMAERVVGKDWLQEECDNLAREGLRTLVVAQKLITEEEYLAWQQRYEEAKLSMVGRDMRVREVIDTLEHELELLTLTGVEDKLQLDVKNSLEALRNAGIKVWMLTGDKVETATCIAISAGMKSRLQQLFFMESKNVKTQNDCERELKKFAKKHDTVLIIDGTTLEICLRDCLELFMQVACKAPAVCVCRCSPTQKAAVVRAISQHTGKRTCAIGDGGNDVSMIQAAHVGVGIVGKEGKQASLAADFSITQFRHLTRLVLWHGRNSYKRSARLSQFVIHRGLIISIIQFVFSCLFFYVAIPIYNGWLLVGYSTFYTNLPVFSLILDEDVSESIAFMYPELYRELQKGRSLSMKTFFLWVWKSIYQGSVIMLLAIVLFEESFLNIIAITFTALIFSELLNVVSEIHKWHWIMVVSEISTLIIYIFSMFILKSYFDITFILTWQFLWKSILITIASWVPMHFFKILQRKFRPPQYSKLTE